MITLESTKTAFEAWRATRTNKSSPIPTKLWDMVKHLLLKHKKSEIYKALQLSSKQVKKHCSIDIKSIHSIDNSQKATNKPRMQQIVANEDFVLTALLPITNEASMSELTLKGNAKSLQLRLPTSALCGILPMLGQLL
jgi:hypothetical protein